MQQIAELTAEVKKDRDIPNLGIIIDILNNGRPPFFSIPLNSSTKDFINPPSNPIQNPSTIDLTTPKPQHATTLYQTVSYSKYQPSNLPSSSKPKYEQA